MSPPLKHCILLTDQIEADRACVAENANSTRVGPDACLERRLFFVVLVVVIRASIPTSRMQLTIWHFLLINLTLEHCFGWTRKLFHEFVEGTLDFGSRFSSKLHFADIVPPSLKLLVYLLED